MKAISIFILFTSLTFSSWSQDAIVKRDGSKIDAKVVEITTTTIKYRNFDQPNGPVRNIAINEVEEIIYNDGTWEKFEKTEKTVAAQQADKPSRSMREPKDKILGHGLFIEGMIGINHIKQKDNISYYDAYGNFIQQTGTISSNYASLSFRLGNKWYFGTNEKWRPGIQATYFKLGLYINQNSNSASALMRNSVSLANVGFANAFKFNEKIGMEANANVGFTVINMLPPWYYNPAVGINYGVEVKFRYNALAVGLDYSRMDANFDHPRRVSMDVLSVTVGVKF